MRPGPPEGRVALGAAFVAKRATFERPDAALIRVMGEVNGVEPLVSAFSRRLGLALRLAPFLNGPWFEAKALNPSAIPGKGG